MEVYNSILESQRALEATFSQRFMQLDAALKAASPHSHPTISSLSKEVNCFKEQMSEMMGLLKKQILAIGSTVDAIEMRHRKKFLLFNGIPEDTGEDIASEVAGLCHNKLNLPSVSRDSIRIAYRLGVSGSRRPRPVLVRFGDYQVRNQVWSAKKSLKGSSVVISEFLTKERQALFIEARKHFGMRKVWTTDGNIFIKLPNGKKERLAGDQQLQALKSQHATVVVKVSADASRLPSLTGPVAVAAAAAEQASATPIVPEPAASTAPVLNSAEPAKGTAAAASRKKRAT